MILMAIEKIIFNITNMPSKTIYETIFKGVIFGSFFGITYFAFDGLMKSTDDQIKLLREKKEILKEKEKILREQGKILREELECEETLSQSVN